MREVEAVALAGSRASTFSDAHSDVDLYVYVSQPLSMGQRAAVAKGAKRAEIGNSFWEPGDEWIDDETGISVDVMFRTTEWMEDQLDRVLRRHEASVGYSTCFWYNVRNSQPLFDRVGWWAAIQKTAMGAYAEKLKLAIIAKNYPILRRNMSSYRHQIELALERRDFVSVHHRVTALLSSYFDILFALNELPHPGEKRLLEFAKAQCRQLPTGMTESVEALLNQPSVEAVDVLVDGLEPFIPDGI